MGMLTIADLRGEIKDYNYDVLTGGDDNLAQRCLDKARLWAKAKIIQAHGAYDEEDEGVRLVVLKRALYELYSVSENESIAQDKKEDAMELLRALFGNAVDATGYSAGSAVPQSPLATGAVSHADERRDKPFW